MDFSKAGALHELLAPFRFLDDHVFVTKAGEVGIVLQLEGIDYECLTDAVLEDQHDRLVAAMRPFDEDFRTYQCLVKLEGADIPAPEPSESKIVQNTVRTRLEFLKSRPKSLYTVTLYRVILYKPNGWNQKLKRFSHSKLKRNAARLLSEVRSLQTAVNDLIGSTMLSRTEIFRFFRFLGSFDQSVAAAEQLVYDDHLDYWMTSTTPQPTEEGGLCFDRQYAEVLTLRGLPKQTWPNVLKELLAIRGNFLLCTEYQRIGNDKAVEQINNAESHWHYAQWVKSIPALIQLISNRGKRDDIVVDEAAKADVEDLAAMVRRIKTEGDPMGRFSFTGVFFGREAGAVESAVAEAVKVIGNQEGSLIRETAWALGAYLSIIPGTTAKWRDSFRQRENMLLQSQWVDLSFVYNHSKGSRVNAHLNREYLMVLETRIHTPYFLNLHDDDLPDFLVFGKKGAGKSFTVGMLTDHAQKYNPFTYILDVGGSYKHIVAKHRGFYLEMKGRSQGFTMNPFALERTENNLEFLSTFVGMLLHYSGYTTTPKDDLAIDKAVRKAERLRDLELPEHLLEYLYNWIGEGRYAYLFDNAKDTLHIAELQCFDFQGMATSPKVLGPVFFYVFQKINDTLYHPKHAERLKLVIADELWKFLRTKAAREFFIEAGKTLRKHNGGIGLVTQSAGDLKKAGLLSMVNELCPTKYLLANPGANRDFYRRAFDLNEAEVNEFAGLVPKKHVFVKTPNWSKVLEVNVDPDAMMYYGSDPNTNKRRLAASA